MQTCLSVVGVCASWFKAMFGESIITVCQSLCSGCVGIGGGCFGGICAPIIPYIDSVMARLTDLFSPK